METQTQNNIKVVDAEKHTANVHLISAAPELLEALEMHLKLFDEMIRYIGSMALNDYQLLNEAPIKARQAIAKAKGE